MAKKQIRQVEKKDHIRLRIESEELYKRLEGFVPIWRYTAIPDAREYIEMYYDMINSIMKDWCKEITINFIHIASDGSKIELEGKEGSITIVKKKNKKQKENENIDPELRFRKHTKKTIIEEYVQETFGEEPTFEDDLPF